MILNEGTKSAASLPDDPDAPRVREQIQGFQFQSRDRLSPQSNSPVVAHSKVHFELEATEKAEILEESGDAEPPQSSTLNNRQRFEKMRLEFEASLNHSIKRTSNPSTSSPALPATRLAPVSTPGFARGATLDSSA